MISGLLQQLGNLTQLKYITTSEAALAGIIPASWGGGWTCINNITILIVGAQVKTFL